MATQTVEKRKTFEEFLLDEKLVTKKQLADIHLHQQKNKQTLEESLVQGKFLDEEKFARAKAKYFHLPYVDLRGQSISKAAFSVISRDAIENYQFIPFSREKDAVRVALVDPANLQALEALEFLAQEHQYRIELYLTSKKSYEEIIRKSRNISAEVGEALAVMQEKESKKTAKLKKTGEEVEMQKGRLSAEAPITRIVDVIIKHAITAGASDIHIEPQENDLRIRYRVDGVLHSSLVVPKIVHPAVVSRIKILSNLKIDEQRLPQDGRFHMDIEKHSIDFRVSSLPTVNGEKIVMRILDKSGGVPTLEDLGFSGIKLQRVKENITKANGMFLVTGPTGSGKSTTLYAVLNMINKIGVNIVTMEDPVEYFIPGVNQAQVNPEIGLTFASGLRSILRQDPNVIMVGEIRDKETAELAVHSALTGHLVFSTLHTNDAIGAVPRLLDMGIEPFLLSASLNGVAAQRLVRRICPSCKHEIKASEDIKQTISEKLKDIPKAESQGIDLKKIRIYEGRGCKVCSSTGYKGRIAILEVMPVSEKIREMMISNQISEHSISLQAKEEGMINMEQDGYVKALKGITTVEEVIRVTKE